MRGSCRLDATARHLAAFDFLEITTWCEPAGGMLAASEETSEGFMVSEQQRQLKLVNAAYRGNTWTAKEVGEVMDVFDLLYRDAVEKKDRQSIAWYRGKSIGHLESKDGFEDSALLKMLNLRAVSSFVEVNVCDDLMLLVDMNVIASDGAVFSRNECKARNLTRFPSPAHIESTCRSIRLAKPRTDYKDVWLGISGGAIQEVNLMEVFNARSNEKR